MLRQNYIELFGELFKEMCCQVNNENLSPVEGVISYLNTRYKLKWTSVKYSAI